MKKRKIIKGAALGAALTGAALGLSGCAFHPGNMDVTDVYGPPIVQDEPETQTAPPADFDPSDMPIEAVYGPPEDFISPEMTTGPTDEQPAEETAP